MKVSREQAAANRERIVEVAGKLFRENGFDGIGVADLMKAAGLTHGGFYGHFKSKDALAADACSPTMARGSGRVAAVARMSRGDARGDDVKQYLAEFHCDGAGEGCRSAAGDRSARSDPGDTRARGALERSPAQSNNSKRVLDHGRRAAPASHAAGHGRHR